MTLLGLHKVASRQKNGLMSHFVVPDDWRPLGLQIEMWTGKWSTYRTLLTSRLLSMLGELATGHVLFYNH